MPRTKGAKDSKERKQKKKLHLTSKQLYAKAEKYKQLADAEKRSEDKKINAFFPQSKAQNVLDDASIISGSSGSDSDDTDETNDADNSSRYSLVKAKYARLEMQLSVSTNKSQQRSIIGIKVPRCQTAY